MATEVTVVATEVIEAMGDMEVMVATAEATAEVTEVIVEATEAMADTDTAKDLQMPSPSPKPAQLLYRKLTLRPNRKLMFRSMLTHYITMPIILSRGQQNQVMEVMVATEVMEVTVVATEAKEAMEDTVEVMVATVEVMEVTVEAMVDTDTANDLQMPSLKLRPAQLLYRKLTLRPNRKLMLRPMHSITMPTLHLTMANNIILPRDQPNLSLEVQEVMEVAVMDMGAMEAVHMEVITAEVGDIMEATDPMEVTKATVVMVAITDKVPMESSYSILTSKVKT